MSISSAPSATASSTSRSFTSSGLWPHGNAVATLATFTPRPGKALLRRRNQVRVDAHRGDRRDVRIARIGPHRLRAERRHLAGRVLPLERRQVAAANRELERPDLRVLLDRALRELGGALLDGHLVDRADARQPLLERQLEAAREDRRLRHGAQCKRSPGRCGLVERLMIYYRYMTDISPLATVLDLALARTLVLRHVDTPLGHHHGVSLSDLALLLELRDSADGRLRRSDLAERLGVTASGIARQVPRSSASDSLDASRTRATRGSRSSRSRMRVAGSPTKRRRQPKRPRRRSSRACGPSPPIAPNSASWSRSCAS